MSLVEGLPPRELSELSPEEIVAAKQMIPPGSRLKFEINGHELNVTLMSVDPDGRVDINLHNVDITEFQTIARTLSGAGFLKHLTDITVLPEVIDDYPS